MLDLSRLDTTFIQAGGSCVLSSYAVVNHYFTGTPIGSAFEDYCRHFGIAFTDSLDAERRYEPHFDAEWNRRKCKGYEVIIDLHNNSSQGGYVTARRTFSAEFFPSPPANLGGLESRLMLEDAILNITYSPPKAYHSVTVFACEGGLKVRNTTEQGIRSIVTLADLDGLRDSVLYSRCPSVG